MSLPFHTSVKMRGTPIDQFFRTVNINGLPAPVYQGGFNGPEGVDLYPTLRKEGVALTLDTSAPNTFKLAGAGDRIYARLEALSFGVVQGTTIATASFRFVDTLPIDPAGTAPALGDTVMGSSGGTVAKATANDPGINYVVDIIAAPARMAPIVQLAVVCRL